MPLPDPNTKIHYRSNNVFGGPVYLGRRVACHLDATREKALARFHRDVSVIQGAFNTTVAASAGTHDFDRVLDVSIPGVSYSDQQRFFRENGWAAWVRSPPSFSWHIHMVSLGGTSRVGIYVPGQISDYYGHRSGLAGHVADNTWHPENIAATVFDYAAYHNEDDAMTEAEHKALMQILRLLERAVPNIAERDQTVAARQKAAAARDNNLAAAIARGFDDLTRELKGSSADVRGKVEAAKERIVTAVRTAVDEIDETPTQDGETK